MAVVAVVAVAVAVAVVVVVVDINGSYVTIKETGFLANLWAIAKYCRKNPVSGHPYSKHDFYELN